ncbi:SH3 domain-containing protein [Cyanobacterium stanieri LEGE 03274]|uniref:SH3 domain-containing protein n=1 Tax=Cyanobacterium stanieri LEGE 03274 TaxID=1828756 RepID=A0ABR9V6D5_9CHRO|nr:SH3 domain-containing protein [Cyanobacterium stanieri]MBE9223443.1 SH3 domain-containing protein [Cyanobacterium stanieri LEGE 03274]
MSFKTLLLASLLFSFTPVNRAWSATHLQVCTNSGNGVVNIRSGPGTNHSVVNRVRHGDDLHYSWDGYMTDDDSMPPRDRQGYYWVRVRPSVMGDNMGFIRADFMGCDSMNLQQSLTE